MKRTEKLAENNNFDNRQALEKIPLTLDSILGKINYYIYKTRMGCYEKAFKDQK